MAFLRQLARCLRQLFRRQQTRADIAEEMRFYREQRTRSTDNAADGGSSDEARYAALRRVGNVVITREEARGVRGFGWLEEIWNDLRFALRGLRRTPGFAVVAVVIAALGIGAATAMFSTVNALVLRPIALPEPNRLVAVYETNLSRNLPLFSVSVANYMDWKVLAQSWESLAALNWHAMNLTGEGESELVQVKEVTANFLPTLGIPIVLGRNFIAEEDQPGGSRVAILSDAFWQRRFGGARDVLGRAITLDGAPYTVVGISGPGHPLPGDLEVAIPLAATSAAADRRMNHDLVVYGRLKRDVTIEQAEAELKGIAVQLWAGYPETDRGWSIRLVPFAREIVGDGIRDGLYVLLGSVGLLLLIACANLSNLLLVRASARAHELAIRTALGASRMRIIRQIVTESLVVTLAGGLLGVLVSLWTVGLMRSLPLPRAGEISVDFTVLGLAIMVTLLAGLLSGLGPAVQASRARPQEFLKDRAPRSGHHSSLRDIMVVAQIAISLTLLVGATLLGRSFLRLLQVNPGFNTENVVTVSLRPQGNEQAVRFYERVTERIADLPGVTTVGLISLLPLTDGNTSNNIFPVGPSALPTGESIQASWRLVDGGYFDAMQIPLVRGRTFAGLSPDEAVRSAVLSSSFARRLFGDADPIGRQIDSVRAGGDRLTVIGVVGDVRSQKLGIESGPTFYWSMHRFIYGPMHLVVRGNGDAAALLPSIRAAVKEVDPTVPVFRVRTLEQLRVTSLEHEQLMLSLLGGFTAVALLLAALGTYGVITFTVRQRMQEIGIRLAVGAQSGDIMQLVLGQGMRLVAIGVVLGLTAALASARLIAAMLYQTGSTDLASYLLATAVLGLTALIACWLPARRAGKIDPMAVLRAE